MLLCNQSRTECLKLLYKKTESRDFSLKKLWQKEANTVPKGSYKFIIRPDLSTLNVWPNMFSHVPLPIATPRARKCGGGLSWVPLALL